MSRFDTTFNTRVMPANERAFGVDVCLSRGALVSEEFTARRDILPGASSTQDGIRFDFVLRDYYIPVGQVDMDGETVVPRSGDRIHDGTDVFEIFPEDEFTHPVERRDPSTWLVHTKQVHE